jgi:multiple sugar transport system ATP-binding protein
MEIQVRNLVKEYTSGGKVAVRNVSFDVHDGEFLVLVGPSGCGKTTTLRLLVGLEDITSGEIRFGERLVNEIRPRDRNVAMVFQDYAVFPHMTVFDNIAYGLRSRGGMERREIAKRVSHAAEMFRIDSLLKRKPRQLSGGERQRVALSRAMVRDAELYLFDEPLSNLDAQLRYEAREDILALHHEKRKPTVYVTHDQSEAMALGDRIAVMKDGQIQQIGTGTELYTQPTNLFVAFFLGAPSINIFDVTLERDADDIYAKGAAFRLLLPRRLHSLVEAHLNKPVKLGVRPEDLLVPKSAPFEVSEVNSFEGVLNEIEPTASGCAAYLTSVVGNLDYIATFKLRLPASYIGREIPLAINMEKIQLFDAATEASLIYPQPSQV